VGETDSRDETGTRDRHVRSSQTCSLSWGATLLANASTHELTMGRAMSRTHTYSDTSQVCENPRAACSQVAARVFVRAGWCGACRQRRRTQRSFQGSKMRLTLAPREAPCSRASRERHAPRHAWRVRAQGRGGGACTVTRETLPARRCDTLSALCGSPPPGTTRGQASTSGKVIARASSSFRRSMSASKSFPPFSLISLSSAQDSAHEQACAQLDAPACAMHAGAFLHAPWKRPRVDSSFSLRARSWRASLLKITLIS